MIQNKTGIVILIFLLALPLSYGPKALLCMLLVLLSLKHWNKKELIFVFILSLRLFLCIDTSIEINEFEGKVIQINKNSYLLENQCQRIQIISDENYLLDEVIHVKGKMLDRTQSPHFYSFDTERYRKEHRIMATLLVSESQIIHTSTTLRGWLHQKIKNESAHPDFYLRLILNQKTESDFLFLSVCGFHYAVLFRLIKKLFNYFFKSKTSETLIFILEFLSLFILGLPFALVRIVFLQLLRLLKQDTEKQWYFYTLAVYLYQPVLILSLGFIIPAGLHFLAKQNKVGKKVILVAIQSFFFYQVNWISLFLFSFIQKSLAVITLIATFDLCFHQTWAYFLSQKLQQFLEFPLFHFFVTKGNIGIFLFTAIFLYLAYRPNKIISLRIFISLFIWMKLGFVSPFAEVSFINVDQGDSILVRLPWGHGNLLIDTGKASNYDHLQSFLNAKGIKKIDILFITHPDEDHNGNQEALKKDYLVQRVIDTNIHTFSMGNIDFTILSPETIVDDSNENSLVVAFSMNGLNFLMMGDASTRNEDVLIQRYPNQMFDVVKLGHHGSKTSSSERFLLSVQPRLSIISSGLHNRYQHPSQEVIERLDDYSFFYLNTQTSGDITITMTRFANFINTSNQQFGIMNKVIR